MKDSYSILRYEDFLRTYLARGDRIPARIIKNFISLFAFEQDERKKEQKQRFELISNLILQRFGSDKDYKFTYSKRKTKYVASFDNMIGIACNNMDNSYMKLWDKTEHKDRKNVIAYNFYKALDQYRCDCLNKKSNMTNYKLYVITAFMMNQLGFRFTNNSNPTNSQLFKGIRYTLDKSIKEKRLIHSADPIPELYFIPPKK